MQTNLEESKAQEIAKLQNSLQEMQSKVEETNALLIKERENSRKAIEEAPPVIKETQVLVEDTQKIEKLMAEVESLKVRKFSLTGSNLAFKDAYLSVYTASFNIKRFYDSIYSVRHEIYHSWRGASILRPLFYFHWLTEKKKTTDMEFGMLMRGRKNFNVKMLF